MGAGQWQPHCAGASSDSRRDTANGTSTGTGHGTGRRGTGIFWQQQQQNNANNPYLRGRNNTRNNETANGAAALAVVCDLEGDKGVRGFWKNGHECILDICITNTERRSHRNTKPLKVLANQEKEKRKKYEKSCHEQRKDFSPMVYSIDGMAGLLTRGVEKRLASHLAWKWKREYSEMCGYIRARMAISVVRANTLMWRGSRDRRRAQRPYIDNGGAMDAWQTWGEM